MTNCFGQYLSAIHIFQITFYFLGSYWTNQPDPVIKYLRYCKLKDIFLDVLNSDLQKLSFPTELLGSMVQRYNVSLSETVQNNTELIEKYVRNRPNTAWFNSHIRHVKVMKRRLERKYRKSGLEADLEKYREQCKTVKLLLTKHKTKFYYCKINQSRNDIKKLYDLSKTLLGDVKHPKLPKSESDQLLAEAFNKFFIDKILTIRSTIKNSLPQKDVDIKEYIQPNLEVL